jgi:hypothetical protein
MKFRIVGQAGPSVPYHPVMIRTRLTRRRSPNPLKHVVQRGEDGDQSNDSRGDGESGIQRAQAGAGNDRRSRGAGRGGGRSRGGSRSGGADSRSRGGRGYRSRWGVRRRGGRSTGGAAGRQRGKLDRRSRRRLGRQVDTDGFLLRLDLAGLLLGRHRATRNRWDILSHKTIFDSN